MERNDDSMNSSTGSTSGLGGAGTSGFGGAGSTGGTGGFGAGSTGGASDASTFGAGSGTMADDASSASRFQSAKDAATDKLGQLKDKAANLNLREKASNLNASLADKLDAGASKLRQTGQGGTTGDLAGTAGTATGATANNAQLANISNKAADALQGTARFLREGDLKASVEEQVRTNPARTLLVALGVGYVLGKAFRGGNRS